MFPLIFYPEYRPSLYPALNKSIDRVSQDGILYPYREYHPPLSTDISSSERNDNTTMILICKPNTADAEISSIISLIQNKGCNTHILREGSKVYIYISGDISLLKEIHFAIMPMVEKVIQDERGKPEREEFLYIPSRRISVDKHIISSSHFHVIAGPCAVENREQLIDTAIAVKKAGAGFLRGGAYKPRTSPYSFQGRAKEGLKLLKEAKEASGLSIVSEITSVKFLDTAMQFIDMIQVGSRNMQNFELLKELGKCKKPVLLKRGFGATIEEWLNAAEYIISEGNSDIVLCERGIRTFENSTRNTLDISAPAVLRRRCDLPVFIDPSHASGFHEYIPSLAKASLAAGADGLMIEVHPDPLHALSDGRQSLHFEEFRNLMESLKPYASLEGRSFNLS